MTVHQEEKQEWRGYYLDRRVLAQQSLKKLQISNNSGIVNKSELLLSSRFVTLDNHPDITPHCMTIPLVTRDDIYERALIQYDVSHHLALLS